MKHVFIVHTPVTYLVSISVVNVLKISPKDAIIIFHEFGNKSLFENERYMGVSVQQFYENKNLFGKVFNFFSHFNIVTRIDKIISTATKNEKFIAYIPVLTPLHKSLVTHTNCVSFNFIEEGLAQYYKEETLESLNPLYSKYSWRSSIFKNTKRVLNEMYLVLRGYNLKLLGLPFSYSCYNGFKDIIFFGLNKASFPLIENEKKQIVAFEKNNFNSIKQEYKIDLNNEVVWIGDPGVVHHGFSSQLYLKGIEEGCISFIKSKNFKKIFIKFHRDEPNNLRKAVKKIFHDHEITVEIIPDTTILELLLFETNHVTLIGVYSSLLYYASVMGHNAFSIYHFLKAEYARTIKNRDFNFYWDKVTLIEPL